MKDRPLRWLTVDPPSDERSGNVCPHDSPRLPGDGAPSHPNAECPPRLWTKGPCFPCRGLRSEARVNSVNPMGITTPTSDRGGEACQCVQQAAPVVEGMLAALAKDL